MNHNRARIKYFGEFRSYIVDKKITIHGCDTSMEYLKKGPLAAFRFNQIKRIFNTIAICVYFDILI